MERIHELVEILNRASKAYYTGNEEIISNLEYDSLYDELVKLEAESGIILPESPTQNVGYMVMESLSKVRHESPMLSLDKTKEPTRLKEFISDKKGLLSWKLDGLTIVLSYKDGKLYQAVTRGNGEIGEDITHNAVHFAGVPKTISYKGDVSLRGEAVISYSEFDRINDKLEEGYKFKNPRNLCSGTVRQLDSKILKERNVLYYVFACLSDDLELTSDSKISALEWARSQGFNPVEYELVNSENVENAVLHFKDNVSEIGVPSDGLVLTFDSISYSASLGATSKFPRDSIAFKWQDETALTKLLEIKWNTSRTGLINPIAVFEPVELEGTTVNRASLHNLSMVKELELGIGDEIKIYKANMIIPQVAENLTKSGNFSIPEKCSVCGSETEILAQNGAEFLCCPNPFCKAQRVKAITHFVSRDAMNIEGFSEATAEKLIENGLLDSYADVFHLHEKKEALLNMEGFGEKSVSNLIAAIEKCKSCMLHNFIYALGINHIGLANAKLMCKHFDYDFKRIVNASEEEFLEIDGFGSIMAHVVRQYFANDKNLVLAEKVYSLLHIENPQPENNALDKEVFVITGTLNAFTNRKALSGYIESLGGKVSSSVSSVTTYLINNDTQSNSAKNKKAKELGINIISEEDFIKLFGGTSFIVE